MEEYNGKNAQETRKDFNFVLTHQEKKFFISELFKVIQDANLIDPSLQSNVSIPNDFLEYIYHIGFAINSHSITNSGMIARGGEQEGRLRRDEEVLDAPEELRQPVVGVEGAQEQVREARFVHVVDLARQSHAMVFTWWNPCIMRLHCAEDGREEQGQERLAL